MKTQYTCIQQHGFTLLELLIVISIAGILFGIAIPSFASLIQSTQSQRLGNDLINLISHARHQAVMRNHTVTLCGSTDGELCDGSWNKHILAFIDKNKDKEIDDEDYLLNNWSLFKAGESLSWRSFQNKRYLQLHANGMTYYQNGNFTYCPEDKNTQHAVHWILNQAGHLRLAKDTDDNGILNKANGDDVVC